MFRREALDFYKQVTIAIIFRELGSATVAIKMSRGLG